MLSTTQISLFSYISFSLYAPAVLGNGYQNAQVLGILTADDAVKYNPVATIHADIFPSLPAGTKDDYTSYPYLRLKLDDGNQVAIGLPWIIDSSYVVNNTQKLTIVVASTTPDDQNRIKAALSALGIQNFTVELS